MSSLGKPLIFVPQSFGGGENWARSPSVQEERIMAYASLLCGVVGVQFFVRDGRNFPQATNAWGEVRRVGMEVGMLVSSVSGGEKVEVESDIEWIKGGAWVERDGSIVVLGMNLGKGTVAGDTAR